MLETSARLLRLLGLLQAHREWPGGRLASELGVTARTLRRDIEKLRLLGYPVEATPGVGGGYKLASGAAMPPLQLDDEEAVAVAIALRTAAAGAVTGIAGTAVRALAKLDQVLPARLGFQVATMTAAVQSVPFGGAEVDPGALIVVAAAIRDQRRLGFAYAGRPRDAEPYRLVHSGRRWYLVAWDTGAQDWRTFRVDRITELSGGGRRFTPRPLPSEDLADFVTRAVTSGQYRYQAVLTMFAPAAQVADEVPPSIGAVRETGEDTCTLRIGSDSLDQLAVWVAAFGFEFAIQEPPELVEHLRTLTARLTRATDRSGPSRG
jgi:predicted DNA-binding transcriptional regulator YafY